MVKVGYEQDETALIPNAFYTKSLVYRNADRQQHITCMKVETCAILSSSTLTFLSIQNSPTDCDHKYIRGIHLHDVITDTAIEIEAHGQLWVIPFVSGKKNKQYEMLIQKLDEVVSGNPKGFDEIEKKKEQEMI